MVEDQGPARTTIGSNTDLGGAAADCRDCLKDRNDLPGKRFEYTEANVNATSWVLERVTGE